MAKEKPNYTGNKAPAAKPFNRGKLGTHPLDKAFTPKPEGVVEVVGGDELQTLSVTHYSPDKWPGFFGENDFWNQLETLLAYCDEVMLRHGWNRHEGNGRNFPNYRTAQPFSELWYAGEIGKECWGLLNVHRVHGLNEVSLSDAARIGMLVTEADWRAGFKPAIITGRAQRSTLNEHRRKAIRSAQDKAAARRTLVAELMRETRLAGGALDKWLRRKLKERHGISVSERTIRTDKAALQSTAEKLGKAG